MSSGGSSPSIQLPSVLPALTSGGTAQLYNPGSFAPRPLTGGSFNQMAQQAAGPLYIPQAMQARGMAGGGVGVGMDPGSGGSASSGAPAFFGGTPASAAQMLAALQALQGQAPYKQTGVQVL
jgi:hypothetical protein